MPDAVSPARAWPPQRKELVSMTRRSWLHHARAATRAARRADEFRQRPGIARLRAGNLCSHKMYRETGETCLGSLTCATSARKNGGAFRGDNRSALRTSSHARLEIAGYCATSDQRARPGRGRDVCNAARRACETTLADTCFEHRNARRRSAKRARSKTSRTRSTRLPALRVDAGLAHRHLSSMPMGARCP